MTTNVGSLARDRGDLAKAEQLHRRALDGFMATLGKAHVNTCAAMGNLAKTLARAGKLDEAEQLFRDALEGFVTSLGESSGDAITARRNLARHLADRGKHAEAEAAYRRAIEAADGDARDDLSAELAELLGGKERR